MSGVMNLFGASVGAFVVAMALMLLLVVIFAAMALYARNYIKVPPSRSRSSTGASTRSSTRRASSRTVGFRVVRGGAALLIPIVEKVAYLSLNIISIPLKIQRAYTKEGVPVTVEAVANVKIAGDDVSLRGRGRAVPRDVDRARSRA